MFESYPQIKSQGVKSGKCRGQRLRLITRPCKPSCTVFKRECHFSCL